VRGGTGIEGFCIRLTDRGVGWLVHVCCFRNCKKCIFLQGSNRKCLSYITLYDSVSNTGILVEPKSFSGVPGRIAFVHLLFEEGVVATPKNQSVQKAFALLGAFEDTDEWVSNAELSRRARLSKAAAHRLMTTLEDIGVVVRDSRGAFRPGLVMSLLSRNIAVGNLIRLSSHDALVDLAARLKGVIHLGVLENGMVTYAARVGTGTLDVPSRVGAQMEPYCSALGKVLLSGLSDEQLDEYLRDGALVALTPQTIIDRRHLFSEITDIRHRGYAVDDREVYQTICCVGAPIRDPRGQIIASVSMADTAAHMSRGWKNEVSSALVSTAAMISRKIYHSFAVQ
jgi:DNA-binding IclR family transcriptional regulator